MLTAEGGAVEKTAADGLGDICGVDGLARFEIAEVVRMSDSRRPRAFSSPLVTQRGIPTSRRLAPPQVGRDLLTRLTGAVPLGGWKPQAASECRGSDDRRRGHRSASRG